MVARIWRTEIGPGSAGEYGEFARSRSMPMFRAQRGFRGVLFAARDDERLVITLWEDRAAAETLDESPDYRATVAAIEATGVLRGASAVELLEIEGVFLADAVYESRRD
jgi:heme-degrading monooxygenase HmoA